MVCGGSRRGIVVDLNRATGCQGTVGGHDSFHGAESVGARHAWFPAADDALHEVFHFCEVGLAKPVPPTPHGLPRDLPLRADFRCCSPVRFPDEDHAVRAQDLHARVVPVSAGTGTVHDPEGAVDVQPRASNPVTAAVAKGLPEKSS